MSYHYQKMISPIFSLSLHFVLFFGYLYTIKVGRVAQSVQRLTTGQTVRGSNPGRDEIFRRPDWPWGPPSPLYNGYRLFSGVKYGRGVLLTTHPLLLPQTWKSRAIPLPTLWATTGPVTGTLYLFLYTIKIEITSTGVFKIQYQVTSVTLFCTPIPQTLQNTSLRLFPYPIRDFQSMYYACCEIFLTVYEVVFLSNTAVSCFLILRLCSVCQ